MKTLRRLVQIQPDLTDSESQEIAIQVLQKPEKNRLEVDFLINTFSELKFFQDFRSKLTPSVYASLFRSVEYLKVPPLEPIFNFGDEGTTFHIIVKGQVCVLVPKPHLQEDLKYERVTLEEVQAKALSEECKQFKDIEDFVPHAYPDFALVRQLNQGDSFGEISLITKQKRTATILCSVESHFLILHKHAFDRILGEQLMAENRQKMKFFQDIKYFQPIPEGHLNALVHQMIEIRPNMNQIIYKENEVSHSVYFIMRGEVELSYQFQKRKIEIALMQKGGTFGDTEILQKTNRILRATAKSSDCVLMTMDRDQFVQLLQLYNIIEESSLKSEELTRRRLQQIYMRKKATDTVMTITPQPQIVDSKDLSPEITRFQQQKSAFVSKKSSRPITNRDCLIPIEMPKFVRLKEQQKYYHPKSLMEQNFQTHRRLNTIMRLKEIIGKEASYTFPQEAETNRIIGDSKKTLSSFQIQSTNVFPMSDQAISVKTNKSANNIHMQQMRRMKSHRHNF